MSERRGSNPPPEAWKATALPNELLSLVCLKKIKILKELYLWAVTGIWSETSHRPDIFLTNSFTISLSSCYGNLNRTVEPLNRRPSSYQLVHYYTFELLRGFEANRRTALTSSLPTHSLLLLSSCYGDLNPGPLPYQGSALPLSYNSFWDLFLTK